MVFQNEEYWAFLPYERESSEVRWTGMPRFQPNLKYSRLGSGRDKRDDELYAATSCGNGRGSYSCTVASYLARKIDQGSHFHQSRRSRARVRASKEAHGDCHPLHRAADSEAVTRVQPSSTSSTIRTSSRRQVEPERFLASAIANNQRQASAACTSPSPSSSAARSHIPITNLSAIAVLLADYHSALAVRRLEL